MPTARHPARHPARHSSKALTLPLQGSPFGRATVAAWAQTAGDKLLEVQLEAPGWEWMGMVIVCYSHLDLDIIAYQPSLTISLNHFPRKTLATWPKAFLNWPFLNGRCPKLLGPKGTRPLQRIWICCFPWPEARHFRKMFVGT